MATFGKTDIGATLEGYGADYISGSRFTLSETGSVTKISKYIGSYAYGAGNSKCAIYTNVAGVPSVLKVQSAELTGLTLNAWNDFTVSPAVELTAGDYWILFWSQQNPEHTYDSGPANYGIVKSQIYGAWDDPFSGGTYYARLYSIYATYTPAAKTPLKWTPHSGL